MKRILLCIALLFVFHNNLFANLTQGHWRWRNNNGDEKTATWKAGQDTAATITDYRAIRLRMEVYNSTGNSKSLNRNLQYATSASGPWYSITNSSSINAFIYGGNNNYINNNDSTTRQLTDPSYTFFRGNIITSQDPAYSDTIPNNNRLEYEWCIKPTPNIRRDVTYYFKSNAGDDQPVLPSLTATGSAFTAISPTLLANGGFENDLNNWTTATGNGTATFSITTATNYEHGGSKALAVNITDKGNSNSVTLSSGQLNLSDTGTYMLRFWAIAQQRNALLDVNLKGATTNNTCHYQIYNRFDNTQNGWQMYQYCFKVTESPVTLQMNFNTNTTYYLDDIEVIDENTNPNINVKDQYYWQNNFNENYGWLSGDNDNPVVLPDKRIAWVYNDSFMGVNNPHSNVLSSGRIINNLLVVQDGTQLKSVYGGSASNSQSLFSPGNGNYFWNAGGVVENNQLNVLLIEINGGNYAGHSWVGTLSLPDLNVTGLTQLPVTSTPSPNTVFQDGRYDYIYFGESNSQFEMHTKVARVPVGQFNSQTPWEYYESDGTWGSSFANAMPMVEGSSAGNVIKLDSANYVLASVPNLSSEIDVWFGKSPVGPWVNQTTVYNIPQQEGILAYEGHLVAQPDSDGMYTLAYSVYPFVNEPNGSSGSVAMQIADKTTYVPCYERVDLKKLSPFTVRKSADTLVSLTATDTSRQVLLNWVSAQTNDDHYEVQRSTDKTNWQTITTVAGSDSTALSHYQYLDNAAVNGLSYYRIVLYDLDSKQSFSNIVSVNTLESAYLTSFTATRNGQHVKINWSTSAELNNKLFTVQNSSDNKNWLVLTTVPGSGTTSIASNYEATDTHPFDGMNYYRLQYLFNDRDTLSAVRSVNMLQILAVNVYPNPAHSQIQFKLQGYNGGNFTAMLCDMSGKVVTKENFLTATNEVYQLNATAKSGTYILQLTGEGLKKSSKVIVE